MKRATGVRQRAVHLPDLRLAALALAAAAQGCDALPIARSPEKVRRMLRAHRSGENGGDAVVALPLTAEQMAAIRKLTGRSISTLLLTPDEFRVDFHETWESIPERLGRSFHLVGGGVDVSSSDQHAEHLIRVPEIEAGAKSVFGTGKHQTTRLAVALVEDHVRSGDRVLDLGTGSGILAVAAARLGARAVLALDIDELAVSTAQETVALNGVGDVVRVGIGGGPEATGQFDVVVANIYANVIVTLADDFARLVRPEGMLIVSGIVAMCANDVVRALEARKFTKRDELIGEGPWRAFAFQARGSHAEAWYGDSGGDAQ